MPTPQADLGRLLDLASDGDTGAFMDFYDRTIETSYRLALAAAEPLSRADDAVLDAYVQAWYDGHVYRTTGLSPRAWICRLVQVSAATPTSSGGTAG